MLLALTVAITTSTALAGDMEDPAVVPECAGLLPKEEFQCLLRARPRKAKAVKAACANAPKGQRRPCRVREFAARGIAFGQGAGAGAPTGGGGGGGYSVVKEPTRNPKPSSPLRLSGLRPGGSLSDAAGVGAWVEVSTTEKVAPVTVAGQRGSLQVQHCGDTVKSVAFRGTTFRYVDGQARAEMNLARDIVGLTSDLASEATKKVGGVGGTLVDLTLGAAVGPDVVERECDGASLAPSFGHAVCQGSSMPDIEAFEVWTKLAMAYVQKYGEDPVQIHIEEPTVISGVAWHALASVYSGAEHPVMIAAVCDAVSNPQGCAPVVMLGTPAGVVPCTDGI